MSKNMEKTQKLQSSKKVCFEPPFESIQRHVWAPVYDKADYSKLLENWEKMILKQQTGVNGDDEL